MLLHDLHKTIEEHLNPEGLAPPDAHCNGLQLRGKNEVTKLAFAVDASLISMQKAVQEGADALLVHHGLNFYGHTNCIPDTLLHNRLQFLFQHELSLFGYHYLLDTHKEWGNAAQILKALKITPEKPFGSASGGEWGWTGSLPEPVPRENIVEQCKELFRQNGGEYLFGPSEISAIAVVTGSGSFAVNEAREKNISLFITGDVKEETQEICRELKLNLLYGGHYMTEIFGVKALMRKLSSTLSVECCFVDTPNRS